MITLNKLLKLTDFREIVFFWNTLYKQKEIYDIKIVVNLFVSYINGELDESH
jgi:hypothetical protein